MENCPMPFGVMPDGTPVLQYTLTCDLLSCDIITYGGALRALRVPDRAGRTVDVALGFDTLEDYRNQPGQYIGALVGRYANRIGGAAFSLDGVRYTLAANDGQNHLHGGVIFGRNIGTHHCLHGGVELIHDILFSFSLPKLCLDFADNSREHNDYR